MGSEDFYDNFEDNGKESKKDIYKKSYGGGVSLVSILFMISGALTVIFGLFLFSDNRLYQMTYIALGVIAFILGWFLLAKRKWAYTASLVYLSIDILAAVLLIFSSGSLSSHIIRPVILLIILIRNKSEIMSPPVNEVIEQ